MFRSYRIMVCTTTMMEKSEGVRLFLYGHTIENFSPWKGTNDPSLKLKTHWNNILGLRQTKEQP